MEKKWLLFPRPLMTLGVVRFSFPNFGLCRVRNGELSFQSARPGPLNHKYRGGTCNTCVRQPVCEGHGHGRPEEAGLLLKKWGQGGICKEPR